MCQDSLRSVSTSVSRSVSRTGKVCQEVCQQVCQDVDTVTPVVHTPLVKLKKNTIVVFFLVNLDWLTLWRADQVTLGIYALYYLGGV